ncbi:MAG TPA: AmiS/UreI family transporter [Nocardioidaceae bacterium]|nr:AmiS/UreI family transporter [Nocardioidaceae bacterium]
MSSVGLLYVGIVLFVNGIMLLGHVSPRGAAPINLFVGALQVYTPTYLIIHADGDPGQIAAAAGLYLFGFTYLWVGINGATDWPGEGLGWFSLTVAICAIGFAVHSWTKVDDKAFTVIWLLWAVLWFTFFLLLGLGRPIGPAVGVLASGEGVLTAGVPGFLLIIGEWEDSTSLAALIAALGIVLIILSPIAGRMLSAPAARVPETS